MSQNFPQQALAQHVPKYVRNTPPVATLPCVNRPNTQPSVFTQAFLPNTSPRLTEQLMTDYTLNPYVWNEIADKMNEMAKENRLIKQSVLGTYERMKGNYSRVRSKISSNQNNAKDDNSKQIKWLEICTVYIKS